MQLIWPHLNEQYPLSNFLKLVVGKFFFATEAAWNKNSIVSGPRINQDMDEDLSWKNPNSITEQTSNLSK